MAPGRPPEAYAVITPAPLISTRPMSPAAAAPPPGRSMRTSEPAGLPADPGLRGPSSGLAVIMLAASVMP